MTAAIRLAALRDASAIARVHVSAWQTAYRGIIPDAFLDSMDLDARTAAWIERLQDAEKRACIFVAEVDGAVVGFAAGGAERDGVAGFDGELYAIYLLAEHRRAGLGRALTNAVARCLFDNGNVAMLVWVLAANGAARRFYEALGGQPVSEKMATLAAGVFGEVSYGWPDLAALLRELEDNYATHAL